MSLDDAYPVLGPRLGAPEWASISAPAGSNRDAQSVWLHVTTSAEMLMTVAELLLHAGYDMSCGLSLHFHLNVPLARHTKALANSWSHAVFNVLRRHALCLVPICKSACYNSQQA